MDLFVEGGMYNLNPKQLILKQNANQLKKNRYEIRSVKLTINCNHFLTQPERRYLWPFFMFYFRIIISCGACA